MVRSVVCFHSNDMCEAIKALKAVSCAAVEPDLLLLLLL